MGNVSVAAQTSLHQPHSLILIYGERFATSPFTRWAHASRHVRVGGCEGVCWLASRKASLKTAPWMTCKPSLTSLARYILAAALTHRSQH